MPKDCSFFANAGAYGCDTDFPKWFGMSGKIKDYCRASCNICDSDGKYFDNTNVYLRLRGIFIIFQANRSKKAPFLYFCEKNESFDILHA